MASFSVSFRTLGPDGRLTPEAPPAVASGEAAPSAAPEAVRVLALAGELDAHTAPEFENALQACLDAGYARLVADGADLQYVSSAGLGVFMAFLEPVRARGGDLKVAALTPEVFEVFDLLGFPLLFDIVETPEAAAARFGASGESPTADTDDDAPEA